MRNRTRKIQRLILNKKAASVVVSTIILTAGVLAMSIAVLYWTYAMGKIGNIEYSKSTVASSNAVEERIGYEYIRGSGSSVTAYIINWGKSDNVTIAHVIILDTSFRYLGSNRTRATLQSVDPPYAQIPNNRLRLGSDGFFTTQLTVSLVRNQMYYLRIVTTSGRNFDGSFVAS